MTASPITSADDTHEANPPAADTPPNPTPPPPASPPRLRQLMARYDGPRDMDGQLRLSAALARARTAVPRLYRDNPGDLLALMYQAVSLDISLAVAWDNLVFNAEGVAGMRARLMHALVLRAGHRIEPVEVSAQVVRMRLVRGDNGVSGHAKWTLIEAQRANLVTKDRSPWVAYGEDMLWARCLSRVVRRYAPEVTMGCYVVEDLGDLEGADAELDPVDLSTAMSDADGNLVPAPDVVDLLADLDTATLEDIRTKWRIATGEGLLGAYAGTISDVHHTVEEVLFNAGEAAKARQTPQAPAAAEGPPGGDPAGGDPAVAQAPAGTGDPLDCGCAPAAVLAAGGHETDCTRRGGQ